MDKKARNFRYYKVWKDAVDYATKVYNTLEGGALVMHDEQTKKRIDYLKNFGFAGETEVVAPGINSKMDEVRAAYGLLNLRQVDQAIEARKQVARKYVEALKDIEGIRIPSFLLESFGLTPPFRGGQRGGKPVLTIHISQSSSMQKNMAKPVTSSTLR